MENFCWEWDVLSQMTAHVDTGEPLPRELFDRMLAARNFQSGLATIGQVESGLFDMLLHSAYDPGGGETPQDVLDAVRREIAVTPRAPYDRFMHSFSHIFAGGYAAGYYSYKWAAVLSADAFSVFEEDGVLWPAAGGRFRDEVLARGGSRDAMESFVAFRGRAPQLDALLRHNGMMTPGTEMIPKEKPWQANPERIALLLGVAAAAVVAAGALAQAQQVYRYVDKDGNVVYSDRSPPKDSKDVQAKRLSPNFIENNTDPIAPAQAAEKFPGDALHIRVRQRVRERRRPPQSARSPVHDRQRRGRQGCGAAEEVDGRAASACAADRRQAHRQGLQRGALDGDARRSRLPEIGPAPRRREGSGRGRPRLPPAAPAAAPVPGGGYPKQ